MTLRDDLIEARLDRDYVTGYDRILCDLDAEREAILAGSSHAYMGPRIITCQDGHRKYIDRAVPAPYVTEGELARMYLEVVLEAAQPGRKPGRRKFGYRSESLPLLDIQPPVYYAGPILEPRRLVIVDLDAAYWNIGRLAPVDSWFALLPGGGISLGYGRVEWARAGEMTGPGGLSKACRLAVIGYLRRTVAEYWKFGQVCHGKASNRYLAPGMCGWITSICQAVAWEAVEQWGAYRVAVDSYLIDEADAAGFVDWLAGAWLLAGSVRARGTGRLLDVHAFEIVASRPGDIRAVSKFVTSHRARHGEDPPAAAELSSNLISRYPRTRAELASSRWWLAGREAGDGVGPDGAGAAAAGPGVAGGAGGLGAEADVPDGGRGPGVHG